jgi:hypothetical protein
MRLLTPTNLYARLGIDIAPASLSCVLSRAKHADSLTLCGRMEGIAYMICLEIDENKIPPSASSKEYRNN